MISKVKNGFSDLDILAATYAVMHSIVYDDDETDDNVSHGLASPFCSPISNQDDHETNGIVSHSLASPFCSQIYDQNVHETDGTISPFCSPISDRYHHEFEKFARIHLNYGIDLPMPTPNFQFKEPDDAIISPGPDEAQPPTNQEGMVCNFAPSPPPEQDSTPSARFALHPTSAQLAQFQSLSIHIPMSRMKSDKYNGTLSELFLAINHHFSYNIPSLEHLGSNALSFTFVSNICNGPTNRQSTLSNSWRLEYSKWGHPPVLSISEFNEEYVTEARNDPEAADRILEQWIQRPPHG